MVTRFPDVLRVAQDWEVFSPGVETPHSSAGSDEYPGGDRSTLSDRGGGRLWREPTVAAHRLRREVDGPWSVRVY